MAEKPELVALESMPGLPQDACAVIQRRAVLVCSRGGESPVGPEIS